MRPADSVMRLKGIEVMTRIIKKFRSNEDGAVTVDWVVLTAAVVALAAAIVLALINGSAGVSAGVQEFMTGWEF